MGMLDPPRVAVSFACVVCFIAACGARTELFVNESTGLDASLAADTQREDVLASDHNAVDAEFESEAAGDADAGSCAPGTCSAPIVSLDYWSDNIQCKFDITWQCGTKHYEVYSPKGIGGCDPGSDSARGLRGFCLEDGVQVGAFDSKDPGGCSCFDPCALAAIVAKTCGFPL